MALVILDGNQSATTLSTIVVSSAHIPAHTVVSLGTQAITDIVNATSAGLTNTQLRASAVTISGTVTVGNSVTIGSLPAISGTVTANAYGYSDNDAGFYPIPLVPTDEGVSAGKAVVAKIINGTGQEIGEGNPFAVSITNALPAGTNRIGVVTIGGGTVTIGAGTAQIGSVTASISGTVPISISSVTIGNFPATQAISISSVTVGNSITIGSLPAISGTVTANGLALGQEPLNVFPIGIGQLGGGGVRAVADFVGYYIPVAVRETVTANTFALQGTAVTTSSFTSTTASTVLASFNAGREVLTIFNEGAGNLHICAGATCTTIAYQVRLSAGDYYEVPNHQTTITHSAVFATAGTARVTQLS